AARYTYSTLFSQAPASGTIVLNSSNYSLATEVWVNEVNLDGADISLGFQSILEGQIIYIQKRNDHSIYVTYTVTGDFIDAGTYIKFPVVYSGGVFAPISAGEVTLFISDPTGGGGGSTGPQGPAGPEGPAGPTG